MTDLFRGRRLVIATQHQKEQVLAPVLSQGLGVDCLVINDLDTDQLGTFSGEVARADDPLTTLRKKCDLALAAAGVDLVVASEGSFGPHPTMYFVPADDELVMFKDTRYNIELIGRCLSLDTNFAGQEIESWSAMLAFATQVRFPSHGLILRPSASQYQPIFKGISCEQALRAAFESLQAQSPGLVYAETDMRAMYNPTRMQVIAQAAQQLVTKAQSCCPQCAMPGFDVIRVNKGLPCEACAMPTESVRSYTYGCQHCHYQQEQLFPHGKEFEDPRYCQYCNP
ncbi:hypothetical protein P8S54_02670 [Thiomicrospira sp. R3]|uniref:DUF6671 family protein n=1 Tax=Thiomicrospira sp. R3 TaxID=3035472 RepID=UPI00259B8C44|nr:DUF6671 family protein [Thiomicrospira sp. R3]WFE69222.1 hypothetical protein P8S54_02670 [Thiomicrospira sp. R3]